MSSKKLYGTISTDSENVPNFLSSKFSKQYLKKFWELWKSPEKSFIDLYQTIYTLTGRS